MESRDMTESGLGAIPTGTPLDNRRGRAHVVGVGPVPLG